MTEEARVNLGLFVMTHWPVFWSTSANNLSVKVKGKGRQFV